MNYVSLFSGAGGLDLGVRAAVPGAVPVLFVEVEATAVEILLARMQEGALEKAPIWDDVRSLDGRPWCGAVDLLIGGFPCQDVSSAGKRAGINGPKSGLWSEFARLIAEMEPTFVFVENVAALVKRGLDRVLFDLAKLGFDAEWTCLTAASVGAPHRRNRLFLLAAHAQRLDVWKQSRRIEAGRTSSSFVGVDGTTGVIANADSSSSSERIWLSGLFDGDQTLRRDVDGRVGSRISSDASRTGLEIERQQPGSQAGRGAPAQRSGDGWAGRPPPPPAVRRVDDGVAGRLDRTRMKDQLFVLGNGVVPRQAATAWNIIWERLVDDALRPSP